MSFSEQVGTFLVKIVHTLRDYNNYYVSHFVKDHSWLHATFVKRKVREREKESV